ncbi:MAG: STAS domain-containing protein [Candidatus Acidiferrales bacterium]
MHLSVSPRYVNGVTILDLQGRITYGDESKHLRDCVRQLVAENRTRIVLHCKHLSQLDSGGVMTLLSCLTLVQAAGGDLKLAALDAGLEKMLRVAHLLPLLEAWRSDEEASARFNPEVKPSPA